MEQDKIQAALAGPNFSYVDHERHDQVELDFYRTHWGTAFTALTQSLKPSSEEVERAIDEFSSANGRMMRGEKYVYPFDWLTPETVKTILSCLRNTPAKENEGEDFFNASNEQSLSIIEDAFKRLKDSGVKSNYGITAAAIKQIRLNNRQAPVENSGPVDDKAGMPEYKCSACGTTVKWNHLDNCPNDYVPYNFDNAKAIVAEQSKTLHEAAKQYKADLVQPSSEGVLTIEDYKVSFEDHKRLVREIDVIINGKDGAAKQASLCDLVGQIKALAALSNSVQDGMVLVSQSYVDAIGELIEVAKLRGEEELPHPADDPKLWTARMQDAWSEAIAAHESEGGAG